MLGPEDNTREIPIRGQAQVPLPVTAIPYNEPYFAPPPPPPRKSRSPLRAIAIAAVLLIVCSGGVLAGLAFSTSLFGGSSPLGLGGAPSPTPPSPTPPPVLSPTAVAEKFLAATVANDQETARSHLCVLLRGESGQNSNNQQQQWLAMLVGFKVSNETINGPTADVDVTLTLPVLGEVPFGLYLIKEDKDWKVCGFSLS
ncbi:nuclear transport factor 2 family protein [Catelliglobosispora koreensis]|uniref:DUF4878 domain-containing protein n=1 Tax=Catelliglobosispora koreensis TaxID=129052 RepID=UPI0003A22599|nr:DUF4878 domain-containing protein [Catelliglobosispora koreensis]